VSICSRDFAVWTEHGLFRYEVGTYPSVKYMYTADRTASKVDSTTGHVSWQGWQYQLLGDSRFVPAPPPGLLDAVGEDGQIIRLDVRPGRLEVHCGKEVRFAVDPFPGPASTWHVATFTGPGNDHLFLAHAGGVRLFKYIPTASERRTTWDRSPVAVDHAALLAAILAQPDDDAVRLVYADFFEENGDLARAEHMRLQCEIAEQMRTAPVSLRNRKMKRALELQQAHAGSWLQNLPTPRGLRWSDFWRGFPVPRVESTQTLIRLVNDLAQIIPIQAAAIQLCSSGLARLSKSDVMPRLRVLDLQCTYIRPHQWSNDLAAFTRSPLVSGLRGLRADGVNNDGAEALASSPHLGGLEWLQFASGKQNSLTNRGATALAESPHLPALRWVDVTGQSVSEAVLARLKKRFRRVVS
jgi:uncharacterized protein (TIGR02996 family)